MKKIPILRTPTPLPIPNIPEEVIEVIKKFIKYLEEKEKTIRIIKEVEKEIREIEFKEKLVNLFFEDVVNKKLDIKERSVEKLLDVIAKQSEEGEIQKDLLDALTSLAKSPVIADEETEFLKNILNNKAIPVEFEEED